MTTAADVDEAALMISANVAFPVPALLLALNEIDEVPAPVGVPEMRPLALLTESPAGNPVAPKLVGELVAVI